MWQNSNSDSNCDKTKKNQIVTKLGNSNYDGSNSDIGDGIVVTEVIVTSFSQNNLTEVKVVTELTNKIPSRKKKYIYIYIFVTKHKNSNCDKLKLQLWQNSKCDKTLTQIVTKLKNWIVTKLGNSNYDCSNSDIGDIVVVTVVIVTSFRKTTWHLNNQWDIIGAAFCDYCVVYKLLELVGGGSIINGAYPV